MRKCLVGMALLGLLTGCTADWDSTRMAGSNRTRPAALSEETLPSFQPSPAIARISGSHRAAGFASQPDRGELFSYVAPRDQRIKDKHAAYQVRLSEEHALNAAHEGGKIVVPTPDGGATTLTYERHVEYPDGNWSWIGRDANGADALLTFGEKAVFGTIPQAGGAPLRLTTAAGIAWIASKTPGKPAPMGRGDRISGSDVMVPPKTAGEGSQSETPGAHSNVTMAASISAEAAAAAATVDVLLGYTDGFASTYGGQSQAVTRLNYLVQVSNDAYARSGITARLRLVGTVMVTYPDNTDNGNTLEKLSGKTETGTTPIDPAFSALRAARESTGADLVALMRNFRTPENNGCGIAWLIGGGGEGITQADSPYGYAVVGDGSDLDEDEEITYFCRIESLAHELGHNMGQAHNVQDSNNSGVHLYSYGYREASPTGFYTVMAYESGDSQFSIGHFANPSIKYDGRATGVVNESDNARSMNITMPIVATFRAVPAALDVPGMRFAMKDVNGDGNDDLLWWKASTKQFSYTLLDGATQLGSKSFTLGSEVTTSGDFDGDGRLDVITVKPSTRQYWLGKGNGSTFAWTLIGVHSPGWRIVGAGKVDSDGKSDLLWWHAATKKFSYSLMNGAKVRSSRAFTLSSEVVASGDFNGDGRLDLITVKPSTRQYWFGKGNGATFVWTLIGTHSVGWKIFGAGDVNRDGKSDLLWWHTGTRKFSYTLMNGAIPIGSKATAFSTGNRVGANGDYDGDGFLDLTSDNPTTRAYAFGKGDGNVFTWSAAKTHTPGWAMLN